MATFAAAQQLVLGGGEPRSTEAAERRAQAGPRSARGRRQGVRMTPAEVTPNQALALQAGLGNRATVQLMAARPGATGDGYEREAEQVSEAVVQRLQAGPTQAGDDGFAVTPERPRLRLRRAAGVGASGAGVAALPGAGGGGAPLAGGVLRAMEGAFGADFAGVRVHSDAQADALSRSLQAEAFTSGRDLYFRSGAYDPSSRRGQALLAHELTHVQQQRATGAAVQCLLREQPEKVHGQTVYDLGIGNLVVIVRTVTKPDGTPFFHVLREISANPKHDGTLHHYLVDTDRLSHAGPGFLELTDVEDYRRAGGQSLAEVEQAYEDHKLAQTLIAGLEQELGVVKRVAPALDADSEAEVDERDTEPAPLGTLPNRRFDCFLNAIVQLVAGPYAAYLDPGRNAAAGNKAVQAAVWEVARRLQDGGQEAVTRGDIRALRSALVQAKLVLTEGEQEDAAELLRKLLEQVLPADASVGLRVERTLEASEDQKTAAPADAPVYVDNKRSHAMASNMIEVDLARYHSLHAFLYEQFGAGVTIEYDAKNRPTASVGGQAHLVAKTRERRAFTRLPPLLSFNLKRFRERFEGGYQRIDRRFAVPETLHLRDESGPNKSYVEYTLTGVVVQTGSLAGGHYYSHVKHGDEWRRHDDHRPAEKDRVKEDIDTGYVYTFARGPARPSLPADAVAAQEAAPSPGDIDLDSELEAYEELLDVGASPAQGRLSSRIAGLPRRADDCFLAAVIQVMAQLYAPIFAAQNKVQGAALIELQTEIRELIARINDPSKGAIGAQALGDLRAKMAKIRIGKGTLVQGERGQEDADELMRKLLELFLPPNGKAVGTIGVERSFADSDAREIAAEALPDNPAVYTGRVARGELRTATIPVDMGAFTSLEGFLYHHFGAGTAIEYDAKNQPKVRDGARAVALSRVTERRVFRQVPTRLSFVLHRFRIDEGGQRVRVDRKFAMPERLCLVEEPADGKKQYVTLELQAMVVQRGRLDGGHYYTYRKDAEQQQWLKADDATVTESANIGAELNEGYIYTYGLTKRSDAVPDGEVAAQEAEVFAADDPSARLLLLAEKQRWSEAVELLGFPRLDVNLQRADKATALYLAVQGGQAELTHRLLVHGADPELAGPEGTPLALATAPTYEELGVKMAMQLYTSEVLGQVLPGLKAPASKGQKIDPKLMTRAYDELDALEEVLSARAAMITKLEGAAPAELKALAEGLAQVEQQRAALNDWLAKFFEIGRAGPGGRPDAANALVPPVMATADRRFVEDYVKQDKPTGDTRTPAQIVDGFGKEEQAKVVQEALTALFALRGKVVKAIAPGTYKQDDGHDIDFKADDT
ncbi:MAG: DUF4157 domain-containing protein, partial [Myxococcales bacterium]|nr:DUF4157 domain-containing protein [Myxococcales bacterium]